MPHPQNAEALIVGHQRSRTQCVHEFRRQRCADDAQFPPVTVDHGNELIAGQQAVRLGKRLVQDDLVRVAAFRQTPAPQCKLVQYRLARLRHGNELPHYRLSKTVDIESCKTRHARLHGTNARDA